MWSHDHLVGKGYGIKFPNAIFNCPYSCVFRIVLAGLEMQVLLPDSLDVRMASLALRK